MRKENPPRFARAEDRGAGGAAFSLVEVCLALGIIGFALVAILGLLSVGINPSRSSIDETTVSFVTQDVYNRVHAEVATVNTPVPAAQLTLSWTGSQAAGGVSYAALAVPATDGAPAATAWYDRNGSFLARQNGAFVAQNGIAPVPLYRVAVSVQPLPASAYPPGTGTPPPYNPAPGGTGSALPAFLVVTAQVGYPTDAAGNVAANNAARSVHSFYLPKP